MFQKNIFLALSVLLLGFVSFRSSVKTYELNGKVTDETGQALPGVTVLLKGHAVGATTEVDGSFKLNSPDSCATLEFRYLGYELKEAKICAGKPVNVQLKASITKLEEMVEIAEDRKVREHERPVLFKASKELSKTTPGIAGYATRTYAPQPNFNTEDYDRIQENRFHRATQEPQSTFSIDVDAASYSNLRRFINNGQKPPEDAVRIEEMINYFDYEYPEPTGKHPFSITTEVSDCPWQPKHRLVHIGLQGKHTPTENLPAANLVFLIDVSGSMSAANKLPLVQTSFKLLADQLRPQDRVAIVVYAGAAGLVLEPTTGNNKTKIKEAIDKLQAGGSTAGGEGIRLAYKTAKEHFIKGGNNRVILASDGDFNVGVSSDGELVRIVEEERKSGVYLTVLGYGMGNYKDNKMQKLADSGNGNHAYIDNLDEARRVLVSEFGGTMYTIAKDVKLQLEFNPAVVQGYRLIGYENRVLNNADFDDDQKDAGELGAGHTVTALYEIIPVGIESKFLAADKDLKYQQRDLTPTANRSNELLTVKFRYKAPEADNSQLMEEVIMDKKSSLDKTSDNFRWSAAVATFGMLLRNSEFKGDANYEQCKKLAAGARGKDTEGYRAEMIRMIETVGLMGKSETAEK
ncbi:MAG: von Willebrand factor type A domain-containing protein [Haliscomenobacter sp.]|uniref:YfbK domain-containing protein n=1 Tax=Haliscomenobacter sp. TaxID=2717303 RepID=UPI0029B0CE62|nr:von Willebrand factor type A domain-containing protein [Haliscomenobacter sp.]MDX2069187.1 von Willebrand factor type A domain-containing protein [Haliscomenobacter sp.]